MQIFMVVRKLKDNRRVMNSMFVRFVQEIVIITSL